LHRFPAGDHALTEQSSAKNPVWIDAMQSLRFDVPRGTSIGDLRSDCGSRSFIAQKFHSAGRPRQSAVWEYAEVRIPESIQKQAPCPFCQTARANQPATSHFGRLSEMSAETARPNHSCAGTGLSSHPMFHVKHSVVRLRRERADCCNARKKHVRFATDRVAMRLSLWPSRTKHPACKLFSQEFKIFSRKRWQYKRKCYIIAI
jgi:hypothetical protein